MGCIASVNVDAPRPVVVDPAKRSAPKQAKPRQTPASQPLAPCDFAELPQPSPGPLPSVAVLDFQYGARMEADVGRALADLCRDAVQESRQFVLVDRERIADILGERDFAAAMKCDTASCLIRYGKLLGARKMMHGRINQLGQVYVLAIGLTDVETGRQISKSASLASVERSTDAVPNLVCRVLRCALPEPE
jgi:curli biogenesis system outer membrane secretion channel CsgG